MSMRLLGPLAQGRGSSPLVSGSGHRGGNARGLGPPEGRRRHGRAEGSGPHLPAADSLPGIPGLGVLSLEMLLFI